MHRVAIATCRSLPDGDEDADLLRAALAGHSIQSQWCAWNDPGIDWTEFDVTVVRSTWDYTADQPRFLTWAAGVPGLQNPAAVLTWNSDKCYLAELDRVGLPVVATAWLEPGQAYLDPPFEGDEFVIKPTVGAGSKGTGRFDRRAEGTAQAAREHVARLHAAGRTVMLQPYLDAVDTAGETALIYIAGQFAHAVSKSAMLAPSTVNALDETFTDSLWLPEKITPMTAAPEQLAVGQQVMEFLGSRFGGSLYARVDLLPGPRGPVVVEVELIEPSLFLVHHPPTAQLLAGAIAALLDEVAAGAGGT